MAHAAVRPRVTAQPCPKPGSGGSWARRGGPECARLSGPASRGRDGLEAIEVGGAEREVGSGCVLLDPGGALGAGDGDDVLTLGQQPGERELAGRDALLASEIADLPHEVEVALEVLSLKARIAAPEVVGREVLGR